jgi:CDP-paratose 2-epimerase
MNTVINRCGVLSGPWQMGKVDQGVMVLWMAKHFWRQSLKYIGFGGTGKQVRDILHVADLCRLVDQQIHNIAMFNGQLFNVGGGIEGSLSLFEMTKLCNKISGNNIAIESVKENRQADIQLYVTDNPKIESISGWKPRINPERIFVDIFEWINRNEKILEPILK